MTCTNPAWIRDLGYHNIVLNQQENTWKAAKSDPYRVLSFIEPAAMLIDKREGLMLEKGCLPFTKRFRKKTVKKKMEHKVLGCSSGKSEKDGMSKRKFVFHFIKAIFDTSFSLPCRFFSKLNWFVQMVKAIQGHILPVLDFNFSYHLPTEYRPVCPGKCKKPESARGLVATAAWPTLRHVKRSKQILANMCSFFETKHESDRRPLCLIQNHVHTP